MKVGRWPALSRGCPLLGVVERFCGARPKVKLWPVDNHISPPTGRTAQTAIPRSAPRPPTHRQLQFRGSALCSPAWCVPAAAVRLGDSLFVGRSKTLSSASECAFHTRLDRDRFPESSRARSEHTAAWTDAAMNGADSEIGSLPNVSQRTGSMRSENRESAQSFRIAPDAGSSVASLSCARRRDFHGIRPAHAASRDRTTSTCCRWPG
jgi:hypothetical protein